MSNKNKNKNDNHSAEKAAIEKAAIEKAAIEKAAIEKAAIEKAAIEKAAIEKAAIEKAAIEEKESLKSKYIVRSDLGFKKRNFHTGTKMVSLVAGEEVSESTYHLFSSSCKQVFFKQQ